MRVLYPLTERFYNYHQMEKHEQMQAAYQSAALSCGHAVRFNGVSTITGIERAKFGDNVHIGPNAFIVADGGLEVGSHTHIARNVTIYTRNHDYRGARLPYDDNDIFRPVIIGECVWIGVNVTILPGALIGSGAVIGGGSVVRGRVEPLAVIGDDDAAKILRHRDTAHYQRLYKFRLFGGVSGVPYRSRHGA